MTTDENNQVTRGSTFGVTNRTNHADFDIPVGSPRDSASQDGVVFQTKNSVTGSSDISNVPTTDKQSPDAVSLGKALLAGYSDWKSGEAEYDPQENPLQHLWHDSPEIIVVGALLGGLAYKKGLKLDSLPSSGQSTEEQRPTTRTRPALDDRLYRIFVSHSWEYSDQRERLENFLDSEDRLDWQNFSVPEHNPLETEGANDLRQQLYQQVGQANVVVVIAGMYVSHSTWIEEEIKMAEHFDKPIIGVKPRGNERLPSSVREAADETVGWQQRSIVDAIAKHS